MVREIKLFHLSVYFICSHPGHCEIKSKIRAFLLPVYVVFVCICSAYVFVVLCVIGLRHQQFLTELFSLSGYIFCQSVRSYTHFLRSVKCLTIFFPYSCGLVHSATIRTFVSFVFYSFVLLVQIAFLFSYTPYLPSTL